MNPNKDCKKVKCPHLTMSAGKYLSPKECSICNGSLKPNKDWRDKFKKFLLNDFDEVNKDSKDETHRWLFCWDGEERDCFDCACCLAPEEIVGECGCICHGRIEEILAFIEQLLAKQSPMGVSQWKKHGKKYGYWEYFAKERDSMWQEEIEDLQVTEPPKDIEKLEEKRQAFMVGQMNIFIKLNMLAERIKNHV